MDLLDDEVVDPRSSTSSAHVLPPLPAKAQDKRRLVLELARRWGSDEFEEFVDRLIDLGQLEVADEFIAVYMDAGLLC